MTLKWIGALVVLFGCGGFGFFLAAQYRMEERNLRQLIAALDYMECELEYRLTSLPELCRKTASVSTGTVRRILEALHRELERQIAPDAACCMDAALRSCGNLSAEMEKLFLQLGKTMGQFDLPGQLRGLAGIRRECCQVLNRITENRDSRVRSYQTLGLCAGAALAILFL